MDRQTSSRISRGVLTVATCLVPGFVVGVESATQRVPSSPETSYERGKVLFESGSYVEAIEAFTVAVDVPEKQVPAYANRARSYLRLGKVDEAIADLKIALAIADGAIEERTPTASLLEQRAWVYIVQYEVVRHGSSDRHDRTEPSDASNWLEKAATDLGEATKLEPRRWKSLELQMFVLHKLRHWALLNEVCNKALMVANQDVCCVYRHRAYARFMNGDESGAIEDCNILLKSSPPTPDVLQLRGTAHRFFQHLDQALDDYNAALQLEPQNAMGYQGRAAVHLDLGQLDQAMADIEKGIGIDPASAARAGTTNNLCRFLAANETCAKAVLPVLDRICASAPGEGDCYLMRAWCQFMAGNVKETFGDYQRAHALGTSPLAEEACKRLLKSLGRYETAMGQL